MDKQKAKASYSQKDKYSDVFSGLQLFPDAEEGEQQKSESEQGPCCPAAQ